MPNRLLGAGLLALALGACSNLSQLTIDDTAKAVAVAKAVNDQPAVQCFTGFHDLAVAIGAPVTMGNGDPTSTAATALATKVEVVRGVRQVLHDDCGALSADFLANVLHGIAGPFAGLIP